MDESGGGIIAVTLALAGSMIGVLGAPASPSTAQEATIPSEGPFPIPGLLPVPDPLPDGPDGTLIDQAPFAAGPFPFAVEAHQILYRSTDRFGQPIAVSGSVLVPVAIPAPAGGRGVVAWAHGTTGLTDCDAPSLDAQMGGRVNSPDAYDRVSQLLEAGHIVVSSDYPGLGTPGVHPYLDGVGEGRSVLDSIRAARPFGGTGPAVIVGFSQGGQASIFAGAEWDTYAPEIDLRGVVPIGTPSRFGQAFAALDLPVVRGYIRLVLAGIIAARPDLDRTLVLTPEGEDAYDTFAAGADLTPGELTTYPDCAYMDFDVESALRADPMTIPSWAEALTANNPGQEGIDVPVLMVQSQADEQALMFLAAEVCRGLEDNGTDVRMWRYDDESHVATVEVSSDDRATWILDRLAGQPLTDGVDFTGEAPEVLTACPVDVEPPTTEPTDPDDPDDPVRPAPSPPAVPIRGPARFTG